jgi:hypothetical protein
MARTVPTALSCRPVDQLTRLDFKQKGAKTPRAFFGSRVKREVLKNAAAAGAR